MKGAGEPLPVSVPACAQAHMLFSRRRPGLRPCAAHCALTISAELSGIPAGFSCGGSCSAAAPARGLAPMRDVSC